MGYSVATSASYFSFSGLQDGLVEERPTKVCLSSSQSAISPNPPETGSPKLNTGASIIYSILFLGGSVFQISYDIPPNPILIIKAPNLEPYYRSLNIT